MKIILFGAGTFFRENIEWITRQYDVIAVCDSDVAKHGEKICGIKCISPEELEQYAGVSVGISVKCSIMKKEIREILKQKQMTEINLWKGNIKAEKRVALYGTPTECRNLNQALLSLEDDIYIEAYCTHRLEQLGKDDVTGNDVISVYRAEKLLRQNELDGIIVVADTYRLRLLFDILDTDIFHSGKLFICKPMSTWKECTNEKLYCEYLSSGRMQMVQILVSPGCNLNCKLCSHFAPLVKEGEFYEFERFSKDVEQLHKLADKIEHIDIWGGEALLCPELHKYIYRTREVFPDTVIKVGTNGILLPKISEELIVAMQETKAKFSISVYPTMIETLEKVIPKIRDLGIALEVIDGVPKKNLFWRRYELEGSMNPKESFEICSSKACHTMYNGRISNCSFPVTTYMFNEYFKENVFDTEEDCIDLYEEGLTTEMLLKRLSGPINSCRYCRPPRLEKWEPIGKTSKIEDWVF